MVVGAGASDGRPPYFQAGVDCGDVEMSVDYGGSDSSRLLEGLGSCLAEDGGSIKADSGLDGSCGSTSGDLMTLRFMGSVDSSLHSSMGAASRGTSRGSTADGPAVVGVAAPDFTLADEVGGLDSPLSEMVKAVETRVPGVIEVDTTMVEALSMECATTDLRSGAFIDLSRTGLRESIKRTQDSRM